MKDQFRSRRVALWLNLIPDLVRSGQMEGNDQSDGLEKEYLTYRETLPLIPSIKAISLSKTKLQVSGSGKWLVGGRWWVIHQYESGAFSFPLQNTFGTKCREISHLGQFSSLFWLVVVVVLSC